MSVNDNKYVLAEYFFKLSGMLEGRFLLLAKNVN